MTIKRILEQNLKKYLFQGKAVLIVGARQVGKTTLLQDMSKDWSDVIWLNADEPNVRIELSEPSIQQLKNIIGNYKIIIIDEIQRVENAGLLLKRLVDNFPNIQCIATGSSALEVSDKIFEPMTGRAFIFHLYPLTLAELYPGMSGFEIEQTLPFHLIYGTYPEICVKRTLAEELLKNLSQQYLYKDVLIWKNLRKPELLDKLLRLLAFQIGYEVSIHELAGQLNVKNETIESYIDLLEKSFVVYRLKAFSNNPRKEVSKKSKIFFWDNGIRNAVIDDFRSLANRNDAGQLFENFVISERIKMNAWLRPGVKSFFWRNFNQSEVDYIEHSGELLAAYEIKWNKHKKHKISRAFTKIYPDASTDIITPGHFVHFTNS